MVLNIFQVQDLVNSKVQELTPGHKPKFAIVDTETTGIYQNRDRVIEVAIIHCDSDGTVEDEYVTLINPNRDLGPTNIHGIKAGDVKNAPAFTEIAGDILARLDGRVIVGHNIQFDLGMLSYEFDRIETELPQPPTICTMRLAYTFGPSSRKLKDCCSHFGIDHNHQHSALDDAAVTRQLFMRYLEMATAKGVSSVAQLEGFKAGVSSHLWPQLPCSGRTVRRSSSTEKQIHPFLSTLLMKLPEADKADIALYCSLLDRALEDRRLDENEISELTRVAVEGGLSQYEVLTAHREYLHGVIETAFQDNVLSAAERSDIDLVASLLGFEPDFVTDSIKMVTESPQRVQPNEKAGNQLANRTVCFTGTITCTIGGAPISRAQAEEFARQKGLVPVTGVSKKTDILVVADPDTLSGKAKKAHDYGTRIIADRVFLSMLGVTVD